MRRSLWVALAVAGLVASSSAPVPVEAQQEWSPCVYHVKTIVRAVNVQTSGGGVIAEDALVIEDAGVYLSRADAEVRVQDIMAHGVRQQVYAPGTDPTYYPPTDTWYPPATVGKIRVLPDPIAGDPGLCG